MRKFILTLTFLFSSQLCNQWLYSQNLIDKLTLNAKHENGKSLLIEDKINKKRNFDLSSSSLEKSALAELKYENSFSFADSNIQIVKKKKKSVGLGILLSALLPGAGEFYGEDYLKAGIFFGIEVLAWGTYIYFNNKGENKEEEFQKFADANWDVRRYARWLVEEFNAGNINPNEPDREVLRQQINAFESNPQTGFSHTLPEYGTQQYYELIGKYQNFMGGWADGESNGTWLVTRTNYFTYQTAMFKGYAVDRQQANDYYDYAKIGPITAILNHILSAADAAWTISTYNKKIKVETGFRIDNFFSPYTYKVEQRPTFNMRVSF